MPLPPQLEFFGDGEYARLFEAAVAALVAQSSVMASLDFAPILDAAKLLDEGHVGGRARCCN